MTKRFSLLFTMAAVLMPATLMPATASGVTIPASYDSWVRDEGLTVGDRDGDWVGVYNTAAGNPARWGILEFDLSGLAPLTVTEAHMGFWHMFAGSPVGSSDNDPSITIPAQITEVSATTAIADFTWPQLNDPAQTTLANFDSLGVVTLQGLATNPGEADRYHFGAGSAADMAALQAIIDVGGTLRVALRSDETVTSNLRVDWGDGGGGDHGEFALLVLNEAPVPEPTSVLLCGIGVLGLSVLRRRK